MPKKDKKKLAPVYTFRSNAQIEKQKKARAYYEQLELFLDDPDFLDDVALQRSGRIFKNKTQVYIKEQEAPERKFSKMFEEYAFIQDWLFENSKRPPKECAKVWCYICLNLNPLSQEVASSRQEIAEDTGVAPNNVSRILNELASIGAVTILKEGRDVIYKINPQAIQNGMKFGLDIKKQYPLNLKPKPKKNTKLKLLDGDILPFKPA
ncbi:MAG: helix-turn-helix transcriptional regulator [Acetobacter sp.]|nr:helix-turn-helix transcriptional regulator [Acetobacter sp.]